MNAEKANAASRAIVRKTKYRRHGLLKEIIPFLPVSGRGRPVH